MAMITKAERVYRVGSFGTPVRHGESQADVTEIWFCGALRERNGYMQDRCAHRSAKEARNCPHLAQVHGEG